MLEQLRLNSSIPILLNINKIPPKREVFFYSFVLLVVLAISSKYIAGKE